MFEKEAEEYIEKNCDKWETESLTVDEIVRLAIIGFATEATKELQEENLKLVAKVKALEIEQHYCMPNCSKVTNLKKQLGNLFEIIKRPYQFTAPRKIQMVKEAEQYLK